MGEEIEELRRDLETVSRAYQQLVESHEEAQQGAYRIGYAAGRASVLEERARAYDEGTAAEGAARCGAELRAGATIFRCQRDAGHPLSNVDRHKWVASKGAARCAGEDADITPVTHVAVVWNDPAEPY